MFEKIVPIIEAILGDKNVVEAAVNVPNNYYIDQIANDIVVEVPGNINKEGVQGLRLQNYPKSFALLLSNQVGVIKLTTEAALKKSKHLAYLALLSDPIVDNPITAENLLNTMIEIQKDYLGSLS